MNPRRHITRRAFLKKAAGAAGSAAAFPYIVSSSALGNAGSVAPSNRIVMGCIGTGNQGINDLRSFLRDERVQIVAVCDVNRESAGYWDNRIGGREPARRIVEEHYARNKESGTYKGCATYEDFREVIGREDIDVVLIALPDHWHSIPVIEAAKAGKDIYGEKPLSLTIPEGRAMSNAVKRYGRLFQTGSQQRSDHNFRRACELVRNGRIGKLHTVRCGLPGGTPDISKTGHRTKQETVPEEFNYDRWLGPAPYAPYCPARCHVNFRWLLDYSGGQVTDWGGHHPDIAQWGMDTEKTGPMEIKNVKGVFAKDGFYNTAKEFYFECIYKNGVKLIVSNKERDGVTFEGTEGRVWANRGRHDAQPKSLLESVIGPNETHLYRSDNHSRNFIDCVISREEPVAPIETAHRSITISHLGNIAMRLGRDLKWDPYKEQFVNDKQADRMMSRSMRSPWHL
ncbi:MAG TPA: Gfo/Idh/MocA family oxidoreductase [Sedimentisphaerales bacterium]|nr:Gfo/Idh/MocA family oxidoreductase [Sedimentisphaerales bacterium]